MEFALSVGLNIKKAGEIKYAENVQETNVRFGVK